MSGVAQELGELKNALSGLADFAGRAAGVADCGDRAGPRGRSDGRSCDWCRRDGHRARLSSWTRPGKVGRRGDLAQRPRASGDVREDRTPRA